MSFARQYTVKCLGDFVLLRTTCWAAEIPDKMLHHNKRVTGSQSHGVGTNPTSSSRPKIHFLQAPLLTLCFLQIFVPRYCHTIGKLRLLSPAQLSYSPFWLAHIDSNAKGKSGWPGSLHWPVPLPPLQSSHMGPSIISSQTEKIMAFYAFDNYSSCRYFQFFRPPMLHCKI